MDLNSKTWREIPSPDSSETLWPSPRYFSSGMVTPAEYTQSGNSEFWVFGGQNSTSNFDELWVLDLETYIWTLEAGGESGGGGNGPSARSAMNAALRWGEKLVVYGGSSFVDSTTTTQIELSDVWMYDFEGNEWELVNDGIDSLSTPGNRTDHISSVITVNGRDVMIIYGGIRDGVMLSDIWSLDLVMRGWSQLSWSPVITRMRHSAVAESNTIWSYGGFSYYTSESGTPSGSISDRVMAADFSDPNSNTWLQPTNTIDSVPGARYDHTADVWRGNMLIYGGRFLNQLKASNMWSMDLQEADLEAVTPETEVSITPTFSLLHVLVALSIMMCCMCVFMRTIRSRLNAQSRQSTGDNLRGSNDCVSGLSNEEMLRLPPLKRLVTLDTEKGTYSMEIVDSPTSNKGINCTQQRKSVERVTTIDDDDQQGKCCAICIDNFGNGDIVRELPCTHEFHAACVDQWLKSTSLCPMCKRSMREVTAPTQNRNERGGSNECDEENDINGTTTVVERDGSATASAIELGQASSTTTSSTERATARWTRMIPRIFAW